MDPVNPFMRVSLRCRAGRPGRCGVSLCLVLGLWLSLAHAASPEWHYHPGAGIEIPSLDLTLGGYAGLVQENTGTGRGQLLLRDLSLFLTWDGGGRWRAFSELELGDAVRTRPGQLTTREAEFDLERLYADYLAAPTASVRLGKFLTPVGRWNQIHADPLVWTVTRPVATRLLFGLHATGAMLFGQVPLGQRLLDYQLYLDDSRQLDPRRDRQIVGNINGPSFLPFDEGGGGRLVWHDPDEVLSLGLSLADYRLATQSARHHLVGLDLDWTPGRAEISSEWLLRQSSGGGIPRQWAGYLQAAFPLAGDWFGVVRGERFAVRPAPRVADVLVGGTVWQLRSNLRLKFEYRQGRRNRAVAPDGWFMSAAMLF